jgi:DNA-binding NtrC family response regulator
LIISDWMMPGMRGDEFLERVYALHPEIKSIMITGQATTDAIDRVRRNGSVIAIMAKPWDSVELIELITKYCISS